VPNYNNNRWGLLHCWVTWGVHFEGGGLLWLLANEAVDSKQQYLYSNDLNYHSVTALVSIKTDVAAHGQFQTNVGTSWRPPNIAELYSFGMNTLLNMVLWRSDINEQGNLSMLEWLLIKKTNLLKWNGLKWVSTHNYSANKQSLEVTAYVNYLANYIYSKPGGIKSPVRGAFPLYLRPVFFWRSGCKRYNDDSW